MAKNNKSSKKANISKKSTKTTSRKAATDNTAKKAAMSEPEVIETVECVDLMMFTKKTEMRLGESRKGRLKKRGKYDYKFVEGVDAQNLRPWECHVKLAEEKPYARISANANGSFLSVYVPRENFGCTRELVEIYLDQTERLCEKVAGMDVMSIIDKLDALKREILEACR